MWDAESQIRRSRVLLAVDHLNVGYSIPEFNMLPVAVEADPFNVGAGSAHTTKIPDRLDPCTSSGSETEMLMTRICHQVPCSMLGQF